MIMKGGQNPLRLGRHPLLGVIRGSACSCLVRLRNPVGPAVLLRLGEALAAGLDLGFGGSQVRAGLGVHDLAWQHALVRSGPVWVINSMSSAGSGR